MAAVTADYISSVKLEGVHEDVAAIKTGVTLYTGTLVCKNTLGRLVDGDNLADYTMAGELVEIINDSGAVIAAGTGNTGGTVKGKYRWGHQYLASVLTAARTYSNLNRNVYVMTNREVSDLTAAGTAAVRVIAGTLVAFGSTTATGWVAIRVQGAANAGV